MDSPATPKSAGKPHLLMRNKLVLGILAAALLVAGFLALPVGGNATLAYRDAGHFYFPLSTWVAAEQTAGRWPLWNPYENTGSPLAGQGTSALFYPGKVVFWLPIQPARAYNAYIAGHLLLAAGAMFYLARRWRRSPASALMAAASYAWGGSVLAQQANVVFLVSAAWLPLALLWSEDLLRIPKATTALRLAACWAMMVLGGDPQTAYHAGLLLALGWMLHAWWRWKHRRALPATRENRRAPRLRMVAVSILALMLFSAVQWIPTWQLAQRSTRFQQPTRSLYGVLGELWRGTPQGEQPERSTAAFLHHRLLAPPPDNSHAKAIFEFSTGPWRLAEFLWPNVSGRMYPQHRRWMQTIPAETRLWVPTLYLGILPLLLALMAARARRGLWRRRWLTWIAGLSLVASLGIFAPAWAVRELFANWDPDARQFDGWIVGDAVGGLYWLMTLILPGYTGFRYPGKWLVVANLAISLLSAYGLDGITRSRRPANLRLVRRFRKLCLLLTAVSLLLALLAWSLRGWSFALWGDAKPDTLFGPLDATGAWLDLVWGLGQTAIVCLTAAILTGRWRGGITAAILVAVTLLDLLLANTWTIATAPSKVWRQPQSVVVAIRNDAERRGLTGPLRLYRSPHWFPASWKETSSPDRFAQIVTWDHQTLYPKHHLFGEVELFDVPGTMTLATYRECVQTFRTTAHNDARFLAELNRLGIRYILWPRSRPMPRLADWEAVTCRFAASPFDNGLNEEASLWFNRTARPAIRVELNADPSNQRDNTNRLTSKMLRFEPNLMEVEVELSQSGQLVWQRVNYPGWQASAAFNSGKPPTDADFTPIEIQQPDPLTLALPLPPGRHRVRFQFAPGVVQWGGWLSSIAWLAWLLSEVVGWVKARPK